MRYVAAVAVVAALFALAIAALRWRETMRRDERRQAVLDDMQDDARRWVHECGTGSRVSTGVAMATSHLGEYLAADHANAKRELELAANVVSANEEPCQLAQTDVAGLLVTRPSDRFIVAAAPRIAAELVYLERVDGALSGVRAAVDGNATDVVVRRLDALHAALSSYPAEP